MEKGGGLYEPKSRTFNSLVEEVELHRRCNLFIAELLPTESSQDVAEVERGLLYQDRQVVVKFVPKYGEEAHREMHKAGYAPKLHGVRKYFGGFVVVMDRVDRATETQIDLWYDPGFHEELEKAVEKLHDLEFVHGDIRFNNILPVSSPGLYGDISTRKVGTCYFLDFDYAGSVKARNKPRYSYTINTALKHRELSGSIEPGGEITKQHDLDAVQLLLKRWRSSP